MTPGSGEDRLTFLRDVRRGVLLLAPRFMMSLMSKLDACVAGEMMLGDGDEVRRTRDRTV